MTQRMSILAFYQGCVVLMALAALPVAHAQETANVASGAWQPHRPDNQPKQKEGYLWGCMSHSNRSFSSGLQCICGSQR